MCSSTTLSIHGKISFLKLDLEQSNHRELSKVKKNRAQAVADATALPTAKRDHSAAYLQGGAGVADRALTIVRKKLSADLSPEATVRGLIQEASDPANLAVIFFGWCPFL